MAKKTKSDFAGIREMGLLYKVKILECLNGLISFSGLRTEERLLASKIFEKRRKDPTFLPSELESHNYDFSEIKDLPLHRKSLLVGYLAGNVSILTLTEQEQKLAAEIFVKRLTGDEYFLPDELDPKNW